MTIKKMMHKVTLVIPVKNCARYLDQLIHQIRRLDYPKELLSIAFLENDSDDTSWPTIQRLVAELEHEGYREVEAEQYSVGFKLAHESRHVDSVQVERLRCLYKIRQHLVDRFLKDNDFLWYIDADCIYIPQDALRELLRAGADIAIPILTLPNGALYDMTTCRFEHGQALKVHELIQIYPDEDFVNVDLANAPFLASRKVLEQVKYECEDGDQEGPCFSRNAAKLGIKPVAAVNVRIIHAPVRGDKPL
jgi:glycosyltransferase involved in cell wall biosynthesis